MRVSLLDKYSLETFVLLFFFLKVILFRISGAGKFVVN